MLINPRSCVVTTQVSTNFVLCLILGYPNPLFLFVLMTPVYMFAGHFDYLELAGLGKNSSLR